MKKLFSAVLALALILSVTTAAFATSQAPAYDVQPVVYKTYQVNNGTAPAQIFTFSFSGVSYTNGDGEVVADANIPAIADASIRFDAITATTKNSTTLAINADDYNLGVYKYLVTETAGNTAGVTYSTENYYLVLTIVRDEDNGKHFVGAFHYETLDGDKTTMGDTGYTNTYDSGSLAVTKHITGNMADMNKKFTFTVTFSSADKAWDAANATSGIKVNGTEGTWEGTTYTVELGNNDSVTFSNLPAGVIYTVSEEKENYTATETYSDENKTISANDEDTVDVTNTLENRIDTGISMDSLPYILMLAAAVCGMVVFFAKKRSHNA